MLLSIISWLTKKGALMMEDMLEKKLKSFLPYIIVIGAVYLFVPAILVFASSAGMLNQIIYIGVLPVTALLSCMVYGYKKNNDFYLSLVAPLFYIPSMFIYGNFRDSWLNSLIFLVSYFICGYIGLTLGDMIKGKPVANEDSSTDNKKRVPKRIDTKKIEEISNSSYMPEEIELPKKFEEDILAVVDELTANEEPVTTEEDIDAILNELHNR